MREWKAGDRPKQIVLTRQHGSLRFGSVVDVADYIDRGPSGSEIEFVVLHLGERMHIPSSDALSLDSVDEYERLAPPVVATGGTDAMLADRIKTHGEFSEHARCTWNIMRAMMGERNWSDLPDEMRETLHMNAHKIGRVLTGDPTIQDHWDDMIGYDRLIVQRLDSLRMVWARNRASRNSASGLRSDVADKAAADASEQHESHNLNLNLPNFRTNDRVHLRGLPQIATIESMSLDQVDPTDGRPMAYVRFRDDAGVSRVYTAAQRSLTHVRETRRLMPDPRLASEKS